MWFLTLWKACENRVCFTWPLGLWGNALSSYASTRASETYVRMGCGVTTGVCCTIFQRLKSSTEEDFPKSLSWPTHYAFLFTARQQKPGGGEWGARIWLECMDGWEGIEEFMRTLVAWENLNTSRSNNENLLCRAGCFPKQRDCRGLVGNGCLEGRKRGSLSRQFSWELAMLKQGLFGVSSPTCCPAED